MYSVRAMISFDFQYFKTYKIVYSIDSMYLNYGHMSPMQCRQTFSSASCIILELTKFNLAQALNALSFVLYK